MNRFFRRVIRVDRDVAAFMFGLLDMGTTGRDRDFHSIAMHRACECAKWLEGCFQKRWIGIDFGDLKWFSHLFFINDQQKLDFPPFRRRKLT